MEYSLWNMHGPLAWPSASSVSRTLYTTVNGETIEEIQGELPVVTAEEIHASDLQVGIDAEIHEDDISGDIHNDLSSGVQEVVANGIQLHEGVPTTLHVQDAVPGSIQVCSSQPDFVAMKPGSEIDEQVNLLVNHQSLSLDPSLVSETNSIVLKVETTPQKRIKIQRPRRAAPPRDLQDSDDLNLSGTILPPVDNLWNNSIVGANVSVKTENVISYIDDETSRALSTTGDSSLYEPMVGRLPVKQLEPLSDESEEEYDHTKIIMNDEMQCPSPYDQQNLIVPRGNANLPLKMGYECGECGFVADTRPGLKRHITVVHPTPGPDANLTHALIRKLSPSAGCPVTSCRFRAADRDQMEAHVARHVAEGSVSSSSKKKSVPSNLQRVRYEREEYKCQICSYACTIEKAFYKHLKTHSTGTIASPVNTSKISCVICGKDRPSEADMNKHMRKHRDDRYFCCDICAFKTVQLKKLIQHRRMHTGEKPHLCPHCPYRSARRDNLRSHVRRVHKKENLFCDTFAPRGLLVGTSVASPTSSHD